MSLTGTGVAQSCASLACSVSPDSAARLALSPTKALPSRAPFSPLFLWRGVPYHASDADTDEPLSAQESHGYDVLFPTLFADEV